MGKRGRKTKRGRGGKVKRGVGGGKTGGARRGGKRREVQNKICKRKEKL